MLDRIIHFSVTNKLITGLLLLAMVGWGIYSATILPIDALPDVTNNQVQVITTAPNLATQEVEKFITYPLELQFKSLQGLVELRSISRSGLSVITIVFKEDMPVPLTRQWVAERLKLAEEDIPSEYGKPAMLPPTTGLGEIFQYTLAVDSAHRNQYDIMELRTIQDWIVRRQLLGVQGVVDVSSFGGKLKQYEIAVDPVRLASMDLTLVDVFDALSANNANTGGSYIEKGPALYYIRSEGLLNSLDQIGDISIRSSNGAPIRIREVAQVRFGFAPRFGVLTRNGEGETVGGVVLMTKGENAMEVISRVKERIAQTQQSLPEGVSLDVFLDRSRLISRTIGTVEENLLIGAAIVIAILVIMLGQWRAGLIVASVIPLSMLFAISLMNLFGVSANLMSMGALDFGLIVDGAVILVEATLLHLHSRFNGRTLSRPEMDQEVIRSTSRIRTSAAFGEIIILIVYVPIFALTGIEGKMFKPMALTVSFAIIGALLLSLTYVPLMSALFLDRRVKAHDSFSDRLVARTHRFVEPLLIRALKRTNMVIASSVALFIGAVLLFNSLGGEFIPELDEGGFAINYSIRQGSSLQHSMKVSTQLESILMKDFPEVREVVSKIGSSEIPTDPMPIESGDIMVVLKDHDEWTTANNREELAERMNERMSAILGVNLSFEQPIQMRFNELIAGVKSDLAIKIYGDDLDLLFKKANEAAALVGSIEGAVDVKVEQVTGMPQLVVLPDRTRLALYGLTVDELNRILSTALAGGKAGVVYEGERRFDLMVRLADYRDADAVKVRDIRIPLPNGSQVPISDVAKVEFMSAPAQVSRENGERRIVVQANVRGRDTESVAKDIAQVLNDKLELPSGYFIEYGGTFKNLQEAKARLAVALPVALLLIIVLLFFTFGSLRETLIIFSAVPLAAVGGVLALWLRDMSFSISAGIGFIALFGVAVLNGIVLISQFNREEEEGDKDITHRILHGVKVRLRPVLATAAVASLGFLPMAFNTSIGSEVQRPLATVVIGGLITCTLLTLFVLPVLYKRFGTGRKKRLAPTQAGAVMILLAMLGGGEAKSQTTPLTLEQAVSLALKDHPLVSAAQGVVEREEALKGNAFVLEPIDVQYMHGQINSSVDDYNVQATTGIAFPNVIARRSSMLNQRIALAQSRATLTKAQVRREVSLAYVGMQAAEQQAATYARLDSIYSDLSRYAERNVQVGESPPVEALSAQARWQQVKLDRAHTDANVSMAKALLRAWTGEATDPRVGPLIALPLPALDTALVHANPELSALNEQVKLSEAELKLQRNSWAPALRFGAFNQSLDLVTPFWGWQVGASFPLFKTGRSNVTRAAEIDARIAGDQRDATQRAIRAQLTTATQTYLQRQREATYYNEQGSTLADALLNNATKLYKSGAIGYFEYVQTVDQAYRLYVGRSDALLALNSSILQLNYLTGR